MATKDLNLIQKIVFICNGECCLKAGANDNTLALRASIKENKLDNELHTVRTKCMGQCKGAPIMFVQPDNVWYKEINIDLSKDLVTSHLINNKYLNNNILFAKENKELNQPLVKYRSKNIFKKSFWGFNVMLLFLIFGATGISQTSSISGTLKDIGNKKLIENAIISIKELGLSTTTNKKGFYEFLNLQEGYYIVYYTATGYEPLSKKVQLKTNEVKDNTVLLKGSALTLSEVVITYSTTKLGDNKLDALAMQLQPIKSAQDLLRTIPGLFIAQHAGGGKAEQIFVRGKDNDHGTDFLITFDGVPVNLPSHAHGQGYADMHFIIPETVGKANFFKGPFEAKLGDFSVAGAALFNSKNRLEQNVAKLEYGMFNSQRALIMLNVLDEKHFFKKLEDNLYVAAEYNYTDGFFENKLDFKRINVFGKYNAHLGKKTHLNFTSSYFTSDWNASGQVPERAVIAGDINRFGSIDNSEGGVASRSNFNLKLGTHFNKNSSMTNQFYYVKNLFQLFSNFTFFMNDTVNGDAIMQWENRDLFGYNGFYNRTDTIGATVLTSKCGVSVRTDVFSRGRDHVKKRIFLDTEDNNNALISNYSAFVNEIWQFHPKWNLNLGIRYDLFEFNYTDILKSSNSGYKMVSRLSPKFNLNYDISKNVNLFARAGQGFHSNFVQAIISKDSAAGEAIPKAISFEVGSNFKLGKKTVIELALWAIEEGAEYQFSSDDGSFENLGGSRKHGFDFAVKYQLASYLWADVNVNYANGYLLDAPKDANLLPLQPRWNSTGGLTLKAAKGLNGSLRYRYIGARPATEDGSVYSKSYFIVDAVIRYTKPKYEIEFSAENILNTQWAEAQFYDASRLKNESAPVMDFHNTPGTPFYLRGSVSYFF